MWKKKLAIEEWHTIQPLPIKLLRTHYAYEMGEENIQSCRTLQAREPLSTADGGFSFRLDSCTALCGK